MFFRKKQDELKTELLLKSCNKQNESLSTELTLQKISLDKTSLPDENDIPFWNEKNIRNQISIDIDGNYKSISEFANECNVDRSLITQWISMKKNINRDRLLCMLITLYGEDSDGTGKINEILKSLKGIDSLHIHNLRDYTIILGMKQHKKLDEIDEELRNKQLDGFENFQ